MRVCLRNEPCLAAGRCGAPFDQLRSLGGKGDGLEQRQVADEVIDAELDANMRGIGAA
jgi:hypothetical protein